MSGNKTLSLARPAHSVITMENAYDADMDLSAWENLAHSHGQQGLQQDILRIGGP